MATRRTARIIAALAIPAFLMLAAPLRLAAGEAPKVGLQTRVHWTTSRITGSPDPPLPYVAERAFPALKFASCLDLAHVPGSDRLLVVEQAGKIFSFPCREDVKSADLVVDLAKGVAGLKHVYALVLHPDFKRNRYCYVCYVKAPEQQDGTHVARFRVSETDPPTIDPASEKTIITWLSGGHNGCCLKFGPDGYLYISTGDGTGPNPPDTMKTGQDVGDLLSSILRIDVDVADDDAAGNKGAGEGKSYRIPRDNPFVDHRGARGEIWAYGLRNPWRMSFDRKTGDLWVGDVGWELWEMLDRVERGGNYGWAVMEGRQPANPEWPRGPTPILPPTIEHPHSESSSITDGLTYYGARLKELHGHHVYADYDTGKFWGFRYSGGRVVDHRELADTRLRVVGFGEDQQGEFYALDYSAGTIHRLVPNPQRDRPSRFPRQLSESGLFASVAQHRPAPGVLPYSINAPPWMDHAVAERLVAVPNHSSIQAEGAAWRFPKDSVLVKTISLDVQQGNPSSRRRVETQILHFDGDQWQPYTYEWNDEQSDAMLVDAAGGKRTLELAGPDAPRGKRSLTWRLAGRGECQRCHNHWSGPPLAFNPPQLNKDHDYHGVRASQLETLAHIGLFKKPVSTKNGEKLVDPRNASADLDHRARAYLHANCAHCHRLHAGSSVLSKMHYDLPLKQTEMVGVRPTQGTFGIHAAEVIAPGDPFRSVLYYRMCKLGGGRMPHVGSTQVDREGCKLIEQWIRRMPKVTAADATSGQVAAKLRREETAAVERLRAPGKSDRAALLVDRLLSSTSGALLLLRSVDDKSLPREAAALAIERATQHDDVRVRDLFERFLPAEKRIKRLGSVVLPRQILALSGDPARGERVFFQTAGVQCKSCHRIGKDGNEVGPDLTTIGKKYNRDQLLESLLEPSRSIDPKYLTYLAEMKDGRLLTGLLVEKGENEVVLKDAQNKLIRAASKQIERLVPQRQSLMPDLLLRDMTAQQVADLLEYLGSLK